MLLGGAQQASRLALPCRRRVASRTEKRAKGLEPSTASVGSGEPVVRSPSNKRVADCHDTRPAAGNPAAKPWGLLRGARFIATSRREPHIGNRFIYEACSRLTVITSSAASGSMADSGTVTVAIESPNALNTSSTQPSRAECQQTLLRRTGPTTFRCRRCIVWLTTRVFRVVLLVLSVFAFFCSFHCFLFVLIGFTSENTFWGEIKKPPGFLPAASWRSPT